MNRFAAFPSPRKFRLAAECGGLFLGVPAMVAAGWLPVPIIPLLLLATGGCWLALRRRNKNLLREVWRQRVPAGEWRRILGILAVAVPFLLVLLWAIEPAALFSLLRRHPGIWLLVMLAYPLISVLPQELIYRVFFFERYRPLFGRGAGMVAASAAVFGFGHVVFHNWPAPLLTWLGGWLFATSYRRTASLRLVAVEHALYGCAVFTLGYGHFFLEGTLRLFR
jgi:membrane protease YdiL (CAAX protease family)